MFLVVGLGNIGDKYDDTPHNAGFTFVDELRNFLGYDQLYSVDDWQVEKLAEAQIAFVRTNSEKKIVLAKPTTLMNGSGRSVRNLVKMYEPQIGKEMIVIHDDLDIKLGEFKIQKGVGPRGHKGVMNIEDMLGSGDFWRVRIGVDNRSDEVRIPGEDYVLKKYSKEELETLRESIVDAIKSLRSVLQF